MRIKWIPWMFIIAIVLMILMTLLDKAQAHVAPKPLPASQIEVEWAEAYWKHFNTFEPTGPIFLEPVFYREIGSDVERWRPLVTKHFATEKVETALCIMSYESEGDPDAKNPNSSAAGLFQFLRSTWDSVPLSVTGGTYSSGQVYVIEANIRSAAWLQIDGGWSQWSPYNRGLCHGL